MREEDGGGVCRSVGLENLAREGRKCSAVCMYVLPLTRTAAIRSIAWGMPTVEWTQATRSFSGGRARPTREEGKSGERLDILKHVFLDNE